MKELLSLVVFLTISGVVVYLLSKDWRRTRQVVGGWGIYSAFSWLYDYPFWGIMVVWLGNLWGSVICSVGALIINFFLLRWYQRRGNDWLGVNILENIKEKGNEWADKLCNHPVWYVKWPTYLFAKAFHFVVWLLNKNDVLAFLYLSIKEDSFITTAFLRHGRFGKPEKRDYLILLASTLVSVITWSLGMIIVVHLLRMNWEKIFG